MPSRTPPPAERTLEPSAEEMRRLVERAMERIVAHVQTLAEQPMTYDRPPAEIAGEWVEPLPETGRPFEEILDLLFDEALPASYNSAAPGYLGFVPGGGIFAAAVGDLIAAATNRFTGVLAAAPALVQLEANVLRWFADAIGFPPEARGTLTSGGSLAAFSAVVTARRERLREDFLSGTIYVSDQTHHSLAKAAVLAGFPQANVRVVPSDGAFRIRLARLRAMLAEDRRRGLDPFLVVGNAGTVNTGAVDPLNELADLAADERAVAARRRRLRRLLHAHRGRSQDPGRARAGRLGRARPPQGPVHPLRHRGAAGARRRRPAPRPHLRRRLSARSPGRLRPGRLPPRLAGALAPLPGAAGLAAAVALRLRPVPPGARGEAGARPLDRRTSSARSSTSGWWRTRSSRCWPSGWSRPEPARSRRTGSIRLNRSVIERVNRRQRTFLTGTRVGGRFVIRICVLSVRTHRETMEAALEDIRSAIAEAIVEQTAAC